MIPATFTAVFALTIFLGAALLFSVQPMIARTALPVLGGSPAVWTTCMLFFQSALLAGYAYAHVLTSRFTIRRQALVHGAVLVCAFLVPPIAAAPLGSLDFDSRAAPTLALLSWLTRSAALPFVVVATTAPLLQRWFAATSHPAARDPYFLYAASNAGSLTALVAYPFWIERRWTLGEQSRAWSVGLAALAVLVVLSALVTIARAGGHDRESETPQGVGKDAIRVTPSACLVWIALAAVPSSLLLGVTTYLTTDLAAIPLLWVVPLALYLVSFILVFSRKTEGVDRAAARALPWLIMVQAPAMGAGLVQPFWVPLHVLTFFTASLVCHGALARRRPPASALTAFYLAVAVGGAVGGLFNALVAPSLFQRVAEYPIALVAACLVLAFRADVPARDGFRPRALVLPVVIGLIAASLCADVLGVAESAIGVVATMAVAGLTLLVAADHRRRPVRFAWTVGALLMASGLAEGVSGRVIHRERSFFGVLKVTAVDGGKVHRLFHGSTLHGQQDLDPARRRDPLTYFHRSGPIGQVFTVHATRPGRAPARVAVTGVGAGSLASYALPGQHWTFYELDPAVVRVARDRRFFTYLGDCRAATLAVVVGDARLSMTRAADGGFDLIVLDAFTSDAIPVHLLTRQALALYRRTLSPGGWIVINITNRYLDLAPVVARLAADARLVSRVRTDDLLTPAEKAAGKQGSIWAVLAARVADLGAIAHDPRWQTPTAVPGDLVWSDDFTNLLDHVRPVRWPRKAHPK